MNKHFSIVNRRSVVYVTIGMLLLIALLGVCLSFALKGSKLWFIGVVIFGGLLLFGVLIARSVLDAGIDVIRGTVILPDIKHPERGKVPAFHVADLEDVGLFTLDGKELERTETAKNTFPSLLRKSSLTGLGAECSSWPPKPMTTSKMRRQNFMPYFFSLS